MLFGTINDHCTKESCPRMCAGPKYEYVWSDGRKAVACPAPLYIDYLMTWIHEQLDDENIFPSQIGNWFCLYFFSTVTAFTEDELFE